MNTYTLARARFKNARRRFSGTVSVGLKSNQSTLLMREWLETETRADGWLVVRELAQIPNAPTNTVDCDKCSGIFIVCVFFRPIAFAEPFAVLVGKRCG